MIIKVINSAQELFDRLKLLQNDGYAFRGQENFKWKLIPNGLRQKTLIEAAKRFPVSNSKIERKWYYNVNIKKTVNAWLAQDVFKNEVPYAIRIFFDLNIHLMRYNYRLSNYFEKHPEKLFKDWRELNNGRDADFWTLEKTFVYLVENEFKNLVECRGLNGGLLKAALPDECLTGIDETIPQHYGVATAALDFTLDSDIALFFALGLHNAPEIDAKTGLLIAKNMPSEANYFSIYACKQDDKFYNPPISIKEPDTSWGENGRSRSQKGVFVYLNKPCSFYLRNGRFPCVEDYADDFAQVAQGFKLIKYNVEKNEKLLAIINGVLIEKGVTKKALFDC